MASPHFHPWFGARRREAAREFFALSRALRLSLGSEQLLRPIPRALQATESPASAATAAVPTGSASAPAPASASSVPLPQRLHHLGGFTAEALQRQEAAAVALHRKITAAFVREAPLLRGDEPLLVAMRGHLEAVEGLMAGPTRTAMRAQARRAADLVASPEEQEEVQHAQ